MWFQPELRVLFVCSANVCRSPLAEALLRARLRAMGLGSKVQVRSAGIFVGQRGRRPDPRVEKLAKGVGVSLHGIRARALTVKMIEYSDYILVMERRHLDDVANLVGSHDMPDKVQLLGNFLPSEDGRAREIPDPYYGDWQGFVDVFEVIDEALANLFQHLDNRLEIR